MTDSIRFLIDLSRHILGPVIERSKLKATYKTSTALAEFTEKHRMVDSGTINGAFEIFRDHTYLHHQGSISRLDYILSTRQDAVCSQHTRDFNRVGGNHRLITTSFDTYKMTGGWKSPMNIHKYPVPIKVNKINTKNDKEFSDKETEWLAKIDAELFNALVASKAEDDDYIAANETTFINDLIEICVTEASRHKRSKKKGMVLGKLAWLRRARKAVAELEVLTYNNPSEISRKRKLLKRLKNKKWDDLPPIVDWDNTPAEKREKWKKRVEGLYNRFSKELREIETKEKWKNYEKAHTFMVEEGATNSSKYRRWKLKMSADPDGEAIKAADGKVLVGEQQIRKRYAEYYSNLLKGEAPRVTPPDTKDRMSWMNSEVLRENKEKLNRATGGASIVAEPPSIEEYMEAVNNGDPMSTGGKDGIQYGVLQKLSMPTHMAINGMDTQLQAQRKRTHY